MSFVHRHRVRYHEADAQGFLFNSRYLEIADVAMTEFFRQLGWPYDKLNADGLDPSVVSVELTFRAPARFDDLLEIRVECARVGRSSFELSQGVTRRGEAIAEITIVYVNVDAATAVARPLPTAIAAALSSQRDTPQE